jgi:hypothetical protein
MYSCFLGECPMVSFYVSDSHSMETLPARTPLRRVISRSFIQLLLEGGADPSTMNSVSIHRPLDGLVCNMQTDIVLTIRLPHVRTCDRTY